MVYMRLRLACTKPQTGPASVHCETLDDSSLPALGSPKMARWLARSRSLSRPGKEQPSFNRPIRWGSTMDISYSIRIVDSDGDGVEGVKVAVHYPWTHDSDYTGGDGWVSFEKNVMTGNGVRVEG